MGQQESLEARGAVSIYYLHAEEDEEYCQLFDKHLSELRRNNDITSWCRRKIAPGGESYGEIERHLTSSQLILIFISPDLFDLDKCYHDEVDIAFKRYEANEARVIPILLRSCDWKAYSQLSCLKALPRNGEFVTSWSNRDEVFTEIAEDLRRLIKGAQQYILSNESSLPHLPFWNVPYPRNLFFTGREHLLQQIHDYFSKSTDALQPLALSGLAGIGKSQIALEYVYRHHIGYQGVFWIQADFHESLVGDFVQIARLLMLSEQDNQNQYVIVEAVKHYLNTHECWLLIFDNVEEFQLLSNFLPADRRGHILITTRAQAVKPLADNIQVEAMLQREGVNFLLSRTEESSPSSLKVHIPPAIYAAAEQIVHILGGLPLALDQAGAYIEETGCGIRGYLDRYRSSPIELLKQRGALASGHRDSIARTLFLILKQVEQTNVKAKEILQICAFLHPDTIPEELLTHFATNLITLDDAMKVLRRFSLLHHNPSSKTVSLHRLVQTTVKDGISHKQRRRYVEKLVQVISSLFPNKEIESRSLCERYLLHIRALMPFIEHCNITNQESFSLLASVGSYFYIHAQYSEALQFYQRAFIIGEEVLGSTHPDIATILSNLGVIYEKYGEYDQALSFYQQALSILEQLFEWGHPDLAGSLNNLAGLYRELEQYAQSLRYCRLALAMFERVLGSEHPNVALILDNLAGVYYALERYEDAVPLSQRALSIREQHPGPMRLDLAKSLNNRAEIHRAQKQYEKAIPLFKKALSIREEALGTEHPENAECLNNLALCYQAQRQKEQALQLYQQAISLRSSTLGSQYPAMATLLHNLAGLYFEQEQFEEALPLFQEALSILELRLGSDHPRVETIRQTCILLQLKMRLFDLDEIIAAFPPDIFKTIKQGNKAAFDQALYSLPTLERDIMVEAMHALYDFDHADE